MRKIKYIITLTIIAALAVACGSASGDQGLAAKKKQLEDLQNQAQELDAQIAQLEQEIKAVDPDFKRNNKSAILVAIEELAKKTFTHEVEIRGSVASKKNVLLSAEAMGKIESINVREGQKVSKGQVLVSLDTDVVSNNMKQVKAQLDLANEVFNRQKKLWEQKIGTEVQFLEAKANKESLESQLAVLNSQLNMMIVRAPFNGVVDNIPARIGEVAQPGAPLVRLVSPDDTYISADVSESFLGKFSRDQKVEVYFPSQNKRVLSKIKSVGQTIKSENRTFELEVTLPKLDFPAQPNQVVVLKLVDYRNDQSLVVPTKVIQSDNKGNYVYVVSNKGGKQIATKEHVELGVSHKLSTEVKSGLNEGQMLVTQGYRDLSEGVEISVAK
ncbi:efflux RND transporter periplasmic adaptor subunit [Ekhidna sp.]|uniref:efflux RND transporter periplasmic adaptor subunit n=1 Tax=Ekhidna sp. TaxID=2608089 RepID=UPI003B5A9780